MSSEENAAIARRWYTEGWMGNLALADDIFLPDFATNGIAAGPEGPKRNITNRLVGFPDLQVTVEEIIAVGDKVVIRVLWRGTHTGPYSGVAPTGKSVEVRDISIWHFANGKVVENWTVLDQFALLQQIGVLSSAISGFQVPAPLPAAPNRDSR